MYKILRRNVYVTLCGTGGRINRPLVLQQSSLIRELKLYDIANTPSVAADLSGINCIPYSGVTTQTRYYCTSEDDPQEAISNVKDSSKSAKNETRSHQRMVVDFSESLGHPAYQYRKEIREISHHAALKRIGELETQLFLLQEVCAHVFVLLDLRMLAKTRYLSYWITSPQLTSYRQEAQKILEKHQNVKYKPEDRSKVELEPEAKQKIALMFDDVFLKWIYVLFYSNHRNVQKMHNTLSEAQLIEAAGDIALVLVLVHSATHKINIPKKALGLKPLTSDSIETVLEDEYHVEEDAVKNVLLILQKINVDK